MVVVPFSCMLAGDHLLPSLPALLPMVARGIESTSHPDVAAAAIASLPPLAGLLLSSGGEGVRMCQAMVGGLLQVSVLWTAINPDGAV